MQMNKRDPLKILIILSKINSFENTGPYVKQLIKGFELSADNSVLIKDLKVLDLTGSLRIDQHRFPEKLSRGDRKSLSTLLRDIKTDYDYNFLIHIGGRQNNTFYPVLKDVFIVRLLSDSPGSRFYNSFYLCREMKLKAFHEHYGDKTAIHDKETHFHNIVLSPDYFTRINFPLNKRVFGRIYKKAPCALILFNDLNCDLPYYKSRLEVLQKQNVCCFIRVKNGPGVRRLKKSFESRDNIFFFDSMKPDSLLSLLYKINYVVAKEYEDCIDAVLMEKKFILLENVSEGIQLDQAPVIDPRELRSICLYYYLIPYSAVFDFLWLGKFVKHFNSDDPVKPVNSESLLTYGYQIENTSIENSVRWHNFEKKMKKFRRDPKRFFLDSKKPWVRILAEFF